jgi:hypothetical protein
MAEPTDSAADQAPERHRPDQGAYRVLHWAWLVWGGLLVVVLALFAAAAYVVLNAPPTASNRSAATRWAWFAAAYLVVVVPASFFYRGRLFHGYYRYQPVPPRTYLVGMSITWAALAVGAALALAGCIVTRTSVPNILLAGVATVFLMVLWPTGTAMAPPVAHPDDPGRYEEPR